MSLPRDRNIPLAVLCGPQQDMKGRQLQIPLRGSLKKWIAVRSESASDPAQKWIAVQFRKAIRLRSESRSESEKRSGIEVNRDPN